MGENGQAPKVRADIQMRLVFDVSSYAKAGGVMDEIQAFFEGLFQDDPRAHFDFTGFQTRPCKAMQMEQREHTYYEDAAPALAMAEPGPDSF